MVGRLGVAIYWFGLVGAIILAVVAALEIMRGMSGNESGFEVAPFAILFAMTSWGIAALPGAFWPGDSSNPPACGTRLAITPATMIHDLYTAFFVAFAAMLLFAALPCQETIRHACLIRGEHGHF